MPTHPRNGPRAAPEKPDAVETSPAPAKKKSRTQSTKKEKTMFQRALLHTYDRAKSQSYGMLRDVMGGNMPLAKRLPTEEASVFKAWHEKGAPSCQDMGKVVR